MSNVSCPFGGCRWEETIPAGLWRALLHQGRAEDLNRGGMWDSRLGVTNLWCSPEDRPPGWEAVGIHARALNHPRSYVAGFYGEYLEAELLPDPDTRAIGSSYGILATANASTLAGQVRVHLVVAPYERVEAETGKRKLGGTWVEVGGMRVYRPIEDSATQEEVEWCLRKWEGLKSRVAK